MPLSTKPCGHHASQVVVLKTELAKKEEALRRMEQDKVHFMGNLDKTMAELTESVEKVVEGMEAVARAAVTVVAVRRRSRR